MILLLLSKAYASKPAVVPVGEIGEAELAIGFSTVEQYKFGLFTAIGIFIAREIYTFVKEWMKGKNSNEKQIQRELQEIKHSVDKRLVRIETHMEHIHRHIFKDNNPWSKVFLFQE